MSWLAVFVISMMTVTGCFAEASQAPQNTREQASIQAKEISKAIQEGRDIGKSGQGKAQETLRIDVTKPYLGQESINDIIGFKGKDLPEIGFKNGNMTDAAIRKQNDESFEAGQIGVVAFEKQGKAGVRRKDPLFDQAREIQTNPEHYVRWFMDKDGKHSIGEQYRENSLIEDNDMGRAVSALSILNSLKVGEQAGCNRGAKECKIFPGAVLRCSKGRTSALNCCKIKGWARSIGFKCSNEEKELAKKKEEKVCYFVGKRKRKETHCCFGSKIARIIHQQGRAQLGIKWGDAKRPNCAPLTLEQLQQLDFNKIDLSELYSELAAKVSLKTNNKVGGDSKSAVGTRTAEAKADKGKITQGKNHLKAKRNSDEISRRINEYYSQ